MTLALLAFVDLGEVWSSEIAPAAQDRMQRDAFSVIERIVEEILGEKRLLWLTFGVIFALWQVSGAVRTTMRPLNAIYGTEEDRSWRHRFLVSLGLALAIGPLVVAAGVVTQVGSGLAGVLGGGDLVQAVVSVARWPVAVALLTLAVWLLVRHAPATRQPVAWAGVGTVLVVLWWILASIAFGFYVKAIASYPSVFGSLASAIVLMTYLYLSSLALFFGAQLDACLRERAGDDARSSPERDEGSHLHALASRPSTPASGLDRTGPSGSAARSTRASARPRH